MNATATKSPDVTPSTPSTSFADETKIGMAEAARLVGVGRGGRPTNPGTILRWCKHGVSIDRNAPIRLECERAGHQFRTSAAAITRFLERLTAASIPNAEAPSPRSLTDRQRAAQAADAELERLGIA